MSWYNTCIISFYTKSDIQILTINKHHRLVFFSQIFEFENCKPIFIAAHCTTWVHFLYTRQYPGVGVIFTLKCSEKYTHRVVCLNYLDLLSSVMVLDMWVKLLTCFRGKERCGTLQHHVFLICWCTLKISRNTCHN